MSNLKTVARKVRNILNRSQARPDLEMVTKLVVDSLKAQGRLIRTSASGVAMPYVRNDDGSLIHAGDHRSLWLFLHQFGLNGSEKASKWVASEVHVACLTEGTVMEIEHWSAWRGSTFYVSSGPGFLVRICRRESFPERLPNGTDEVYFAAESCFAEWNPLVDLLRPSEAKALNPNFVPPCGSPSYTKEIQEFLMIAAIASILFGLHPKPLLTILAEHDSGKSTLAKGISKLFLGGQGALFNIPRTPNDLETNLVSLPVCAIDNLDGGVEPWFQDALAQSFTGGDSRSRRLFHDVGVAHQRKRHCSVVITSRTAKFANRDDLVSRLIPLFLESIPRDRYSEDGLLEADLLSKREGILTWLTILASRMPLLSSSSGAYPSRMQALGRILEAIHSCNGSSDEDARGLAFSNLEELEAAQHSVGPAGRLIGAIRRASLPIQGRPSQVWDQLDRAYSLGIRPKNMKLFTGELKGMASIAERVGIDISFRGSGHTQIVTIQNHANDP